MDAGNIHNDAITSQAASYHPPPPKMFYFGSVMTMHSKILWIVFSLTFFCFSSKILYSKVVMMMKCKFFERENSKNGH